MLDSVLVGLLILAFALVAVVAVRQVVAMLPVGRADSGSDRRRGHRWPDRGRQQ